MTGTLTYEVRPHDREDWVRLGVLRPVDREGSVSDVSRPGFRDVILFRCEGDKSVISRSAGGIDVAAGPVRAVLMTGGRETLAEIGDGQVYERDIVSDAGHEYRARWTHTR